LGHPVPGGYKYGNLALQVWGVSNLKQSTVVMNPAGLGPENDLTELQLIQNRENEHVRSIGEGEVRHRKYMRLKLGVVKLTTVQVTKLPL
jgi:hypothetical protein